ncbi:MAG TPA: Gfo/Idh/MocA family oxidoreductase [Tepidiformaceae bacterium]|nr:Gfo/Idh/MocA family oxidoreductase [Tepidiformaceae bacterium]
MAGSRLRIGVCGAGRVFERLYLPGLRGARGMEVVAVADPSPERRALAGERVAGFDGVEAMIAAGGLDAVAVLSPPRLHHEHTLAALRAGLPVLVEKPAAETTAQLVEWAAAGADGMVTTSFSRRFWKKYRALKSRERSAGSFQFLLQTSPEGWGPVERREADPLRDLMPHLIDLTRWVTGERAVSVAAGEAMRPGQVILELEVADGRRAICIAAHGEGYEESVGVEGERRQIGPPSTVESALRRLRRAPDDDVAAFGEMLRRWERRLRDEPSAGLPAFSDAWASVAAIEGYRESFATGGASVAIRPMPGRA